MFQSGKNYVHRVCLEEMLQDSCNINQDQAYGNRMKFFDQKYSSDQDFSLQFQPSLAPNYQASPVSIIQQRDSDLSLSTMTDRSSSRRSSLDPSSRCSSIDYSMSCNSSQNSANSLVYPSSHNSAIAFLQPSSEEMIYQVQFKHNFRDCTLFEGALFDVNIGDFVIVNASNNGYDLGVVTEINPLSAFAANRAVKGMSRDGEENKIGTILRLAGEAEYQHLPIKHAQEADLLKTVMHLVFKKHKLPMYVVGVDFQFDGKRLTVHFMADGRIDFRPLIKDLFARYKTNVWVKKSNLCSPFVPKPFATKQLALGMHQMRQQQFQNIGTYYDDVHQQMSHVGIAREQSFRLFM